MLNHQEFLQQFLRERRTLEAYLLSATGDLHTAEDLLQSVARILLEKLPEYDTQRPFGPWAMGVTRLEALKWRQQVSRSREVLSEDAANLLAQTAMAEAAEADVRLQMLTECLTRMAGTARRALEMKYGQGQRIAEIARSLGKTVAAVEMMLVRGRRDLRACVERKLHALMPEAL